MTLCTLGASLLGNTLSGKGVIATGRRWHIIKAGKVKLVKLVNCLSSTGFLILPCPLTNFEIQRYKNEPKFSGVYSRNNLPKIKGEPYVMDLDNYKSIGTHQKASYVMVFI